MSRFERWSLVTNWFLLGVGGVVAYIYYGQWQTMGRHLEYAARAWVVAESFSVSPLTATQPFTVRGDFKNVGHSPAVDVRVFMRFRLGGELPEGMPYPAGKEDQHNTALLGPGMRMRIVVDPECATREALRAVKSGEKPLYVFGWIRYRDQFGPHETGYCRMYDKPSDDSSLFIPCKGPALEYAR